LYVGQKYYIRALWKEGGGGDHCMVAWQGPDQPLTPVQGNPAGIPYVIPGTRLEPFVQKWAHSPDPPNNQVGVVSPVMLGWGKGDHAAKHDVYLGTDKALVDARDASVFKGRIDPNTYGPVVLAPGQLYYWAIDEVNDLGPTPVFGMARPGSLGQREVQVVCRACTITGMASCPMIRSVRIIPSRFS
jgi:hypothetical protein